MACPTITTGDGFLSAVLTHIDCQARAIGSYGYGALADPGSGVSIALTSLLTIFIALFGFRLLLGPSPQVRDVVGGAIRIGLVLTLATSWPAWRIVGYDLILNGPGEISRAIGGGSGLPGSRNDMIARLQHADDGIVLATIYGSGRLTGGVAAGTDLGDTPRGVALADPFALGMGRTAFLVGAIAPFAIARIGAGILLALAPLVAGFALFTGTAGLFWGWARGLAFCALAAIGQSLVQGVQLAVLGPFLRDVLEQRDGGILTPSAPTELFVLTLAFTLTMIGLLYLAGRVTFFPWNIAVFRSFGGRTDTERPVADRANAGHPAQEVHVLVPSRAALVANAVSDTMRRENPPHHDSSPPAGSIGQRMTVAPSSVMIHRPISGDDALGSRFRRSGPTRSQTSRNRDRTP